MPKPADASDDDLATTRLESSAWLPPVPTVADLPEEGVTEGALCYVQDGADEGTWQRRDGRWVRSKSRGKR